MRRCVEEEGIPSFKIFMAHHETVGVEDAQHGARVSALQEELIAAGHTAPRHHAMSRPAPIEGEATARTIMLARVTREAPYVVRFTSRESLDAIREARTRGQSVYGETCPKYPLLDDALHLTALARAVSTSTNSWISPPPAPPGFSACTPEGVR